MDDMEKIYREYAQTVYKYLMTLCHDSSLSEELTQETFYQAVKSINRFDGSCKISVWLCQIAKHMWYRHLNKNKREVPTEKAKYDFSIPSTEDEVLSNESHLDLLKQIHNLNEPAREIVYLRAFGGLSFKEIGEVFGKSENWARVTFYRSKEKLKGGKRDES